MRTNKVLLATLAGAAVNFLLGFLFYAVVFEKFFSANQGSATGVEKDPMNFIGIILAKSCNGFSDSLYF